MDRADIVTHSALIVIKIAYHVLLCFVLEWK